MPNGVLGRFTCQFLNPELWVRGFSNPTVFHQEARRSNNAKYMTEILAYKLLLLVADSWHLNGARHAPIRPATISGMSSKFEAQIC